MQANLGYRSLHWTARCFSLIVAGFLSLFFFGESIGPNWQWTFHPSKIALKDDLLLSLILCSVLSIVLAWFWERWAGGADVFLAGTFLVCCLAMPNMHPVWPLGACLLLPGMLYVGAAELRRRSDGLAR